MFNIQLLFVLIIAPIAGAVVLGLASCVIIPIQLLCENRWLPKEMKNTLRDFIEGTAVMMLVGAIVGFASGMLILL